ncbi:MAG: Rid family detoxifying hydrolase [Myxococcota bacterium]
MSRETVATEHAPAAIGPYSQAVKAGGLLFCSGQIPIDPATGDLVDADVRAQTKRVMENLGAVLAAGGSSFEKVVRCTIFLADMDDYGAVNEVYGAYFPEAPPARAAVAVRTLPKNVAVEISCIAVA